MKSKLEDFYQKTPVWVQNLLISLYGLKLKRRRYSGNYSRYYKNVVAQSKFDRSQLDNFVQENLTKLICDAVSNVPYYRDMFKKEKIRANRPWSIHDLRGLPLLEKQVIRANPPLFFNERYNKSQCHSIHTTGTTGTPLEIFCTDDARQHNFAYFDRFLASVGINHFGRRATLWGRIVVPSHQETPPFWRYSRFVNNLLMSSYHLSNRNIPAYINKLQEFQPDYIDAYPSSIHAIAQYAIENGISINSITKGITTSAETLFPEQRESIEKAFGVPVYDQYGCAEMAVFIGQCREGRYHIHEDYGIVELINHDGNPALPGEEAEIVCTGFINPIMPLIRYAIGDMAVLSSSRCPCGSPFQALDKIIGRMDDVILTPDGRKIGRLSPVLKGFPVHGAQYIQESADSIRVLLVKGPEFSEEDAKNIVQELQKRLGPLMTVELEYTSQIPRGARGKYRNIISRMGGIQVAHSQ